MKILHTSDWHLGRSLYDKKRYDEFSAFLNWLLNFIKDNEVEVLLIAGDVFDTTTPPNKAQELYYWFLSSVSKTCCANVVIIGGNHDSPTFLNAPKGVLNALNVHVVGSATESLHNEVIVLKNSQNQPLAIVCAVPFLRDRDIRIVDDNETIEDKNQKLIKGIAAHYDAVANIAQGLQDKVNSVPIIGMGHLFTSGAKTVEGDGVRDLYVGNLAHVGATLFKDRFDYVALGHLHLAQKVGDLNYVRYSGSPIPMGFGEANQQKKVLVVDLDNNGVEVFEHIVPCFRQLAKLSGDINQVSQKINALKSENSSAWLEIEITSGAPSTGITTLLDDLLEGSQLEILRIKNKMVVEQALAPISVNESLDDLDSEQVFERCLDVNNIDVSERNAYLQTYREALISMHQSDSNAL